MLSPERPTDVIERAQPLQALPEDLRRAAQGEIGLVDAIHAIIRRHELQACTAADLLERETWALAAILAAGGPLWDRLASPTLRFLIDQVPEPTLYYLELGRFSHLQSLIDPSPDELALVAATAPCWAKVYPHHDRQRAGQKGALACSYVRIGAGEAVAMIGFNRIITQIEVAVARAGAALLAEAQAQNERQERLLRVERMLGWESSPGAPGEVSVTARACVALMGGGGRLALGAAGLGLVAIMVGMLIGIPSALLIVVLSGSGLFLWTRMAS